LRDVNVLLNNENNATEPVDLDLGAGDNLAYTENDGARQLLPTVTVTGDDINSATVALTTNFLMSEDSLAFTPAAGITGSFDAMTGVLALSGAASAADYQAVLRSITYTNPSEDPSEAIRDVEVTIASDAMSDSENASITVMAVNDAPVLNPETSAPQDYDENADPLPLQDALTITDVDSTTLLSAQVEISGYIASEDRLRFNNVAGLSASFDVATGVLTVTGPASLASFQAFLRGVAYENLSEDPSETRREFSFSVIDDAGDESNIASAFIDVVAENDPPVVDPDPDNPGDPGDPGDPLQFETLVYIENDPASAVVPNITISDVDGDSLVSARVSAGATFMVGQDVLAWDTALADSLGVSVSMVDNGATLLFAGAASNNDYAALLASVTYENMSDNPTLDDRLLSITVNDGESDSPEVIARIDVRPENDAPGVDPRAADSTPIGGADRVFTEGDDALILAGGLVINDVDSPTLTEATITITGAYTPGEDQLVFDSAVADSLGLTVTVEEIMGGTQLQLRVSGLATIEDYETVLRTVAYFNPSDDPSDAVRSIEFIVNDGEDPSPPATLTLAVVPVNDAPEIDPDGPSDPGPGDPNDPQDNDPSDDKLDAVTYIEDGDPVALFPALSISDLDNTTLASATLVISGWQAGEDVFLFDNLLADATFIDVSTSVENVMGVPSLVVTVTGESGPAAIAAFEGVLRSFEYRNSSQDPSDAPRGLSLTVNDGAADSDPATRTLNVLPVNDAPSIDVAATLIYDEDAGAVAISPLLTVADVDNDELASATVLIAEGYVAAEDSLSLDMALAASLGLAVNITGPALTISGAGTLAEYQSLLRTVAYTNSSDDPSDMDRRVDFTVNDGALPSATDSTLITVRPSNDTPTIDPDGPDDPGPGDPDDPQDDNPSDDLLDPVTFIEDGPAVDLFPALTISDPDSANLASATLVISGWLPDQDQFLFDNLLADAVFIDVATSLDVTPGGTSLIVSVTSEVGTSPISAFQAVLRSFSYANSSQDPSDAPRSLSLVVNDGAADSAPATRTLNVLPVNDAPTLDVDTALSFPENGAARAISPNLAIADVDGDQLVAARVVIASGFVGAEDSLSFDMALASSLGIMVTVTDGGAGIDFSGDASLADYQALLRTVAYANSSDNPSDADRRVDFTVTDG
ncbi:MAG: hypothetical protein AAGG08_09115, partial [Actinomycetota bacterium]